MRIRGRTLRTESLDRSNARDLEQVVRILREVDVSPVSPSSTSQDVSLRTQKCDKPLQIDADTKTGFDIESFFFAYNQNYHK